MADYVLVTCDHGGNLIPPRYGCLFRGLQEALKTHLGYDMGALLMARQFSASFKAPLVASTVSRLLVDVNRSVRHRRLHAEAVRNCPRETREQILAHYYVPYRAQVENRVIKAIARGRRVVHISSHSFTPELNGNVRIADVGLLYDPARPGEVRMCERWKSALRAVAPQLRVRRNYPYAGKDDGFLPYLRSRYRPTAYIGIETEINQAIVAGPPRRWAEVRAAMIESLGIALASRHGRS